MLGTGALAGGAFLTDASADSTGDDAAGSALGAVMCSMLAAATLAPMVRGLTGEAPYVPPMLHGSSVAAAGGPARPAREAVPPGPRDAPTCEGPLPGLGPVGRASLRRAGLLSSGRRPGWCW